MYQGRQKAGWLISSEDYFFFALISRSLPVDAAPLATSFFALTPHLL
jgi:hypothetical protein